ncbi:MAG: hypothetical protein GY765_06490 [bacterium]|nr:hypothetical protein [bacterium]
MKEGQSITSYYAMKIVKIESLRETVEALEAPETENDKAGQKDVAEGQKEGKENE